MFARGLDPTNALHYVAGFVGVRNLALAGAATWTFATRDWAGLRTLLAVFAVVQVLDAALHVFGGNAVHSLGPLAFTVIYALARREVPS
jgi:hypothetical protein